MHQLNASSVSKRLQCRWTAGNSRWFLQEKAFSKVPQRVEVFGRWLGCRGEEQPLEQSWAHPANSHPLRGFVFKYLKYFHIVWREELFTHLRRFLFKSRFCQSVSWLLHWWVFFFMYPYLCWPRFAAEHGAEGRCRSCILPLVARSGSVCGLVPPTEFAPSVFKTRLATSFMGIFRAIGRKWFYSSELLKGWWPAASVWSLSFGACEDLWIDLVSAEAHCWVVVQLT